jgi:hypothetical protein
MNSSSVSLLLFTTIKLCWNMCDGKAGVATQVQSPAYLVMCSEAENSEESQTGGVLV